MKYRPDDGSWYQYQVVTLTLCALMAFWLAGAGAAADEEVAIPGIANGVQRVTMMVDSHFYQPKHLVVRAGVPVEIVLVSETMLTPHNFVLKEPDAGMKINQEIGAGETVKVRFTPTKPGRFTFYCDKRLLFFKTHREKGMEGTLKVE
jgi:plastocyanin